MKILLASNTAWYLWKFRLTLARALQAAGHEVVAAAPRDRAPKPLKKSHGLVARYLAPARFHPLRMREG
mgnify:CR=1 FL=1